MIFITNDKSKKILEPGEQAFDLPSLSISSQFSAILRWWLKPIVSVWSNHLYATFFSQMCIQLITVISLVTNQSFRQFFQKAAVKCIINKCYFMWASTGCVNGDRNTASVCKAHNFGSFAPFGFAHTIAPFFAGAKVPSIKPSLKSMPPRSFKS